MKALIILENGFEDTEALATYDVLKRGGFELVSASFDSCDIITQCGHRIKSNVLVKDIKDLNSFDCLVTIEFNSGIDFNSLKSILTG